MIKKSEVTVTFRVFPDRTFETVEEETDYIEGLSVVDSDMNIVNNEIEFTVYSSEEE